ncbi:hypothetical protein [Oceanobacillus sp. 1P07AA]|uniref:hypothetical protein n=1 Tax=Oceanobacillus sp. 1P07AA TaxID=3132293 RepID=UPI0039A7735E
MIAEMYKRRVTTSYILLGLVACVIVGYAYVEPPKTTADWGEFAVFLIPVVMLVTIVVLNKKHYNKTVSVDIPNSARLIFDLDHFVMKKDVAFFPRLLCFEKDGNYVGSLEPINIPWYVYPFGFFYSSLVVHFPLTYAFIDNQENTLFTFKQKGFKTTVLTIYNEHDQKIGIYKQEEFKSLLNIKGELFDENNEFLLPITVSGASGNFSLNCEEEQWAYFYNGRFPHEYTKIFRDVDNDIVEVSDTLSKENKVRLLAVIGFLFIARIRNN